MLEVAQPVLLLVQRPSLPVHSLDELGVHGVRGRGWRSRDASDQILEGEVIIKAPFQKGILTRSNCTERERERESDEEEEEK